MTARRTFGLALIGFMLLILISVFSAFAAANTIPTSGAGLGGRPVTAQDLQPSECSSLSLTNLVVDGDGTDANSLILGTAATNTIQGFGGDDCILGGGGDDVIYGGDGVDVCNGGPGNDACDDSCETKISCESVP
jgi:Ca2+-binding RTX toxin-like protein